MPVAIPMPEEPGEPAPPTRDRYTRSRTDRVAVGVCGGLAEYLDVDPTLVRVAWAVVTVFSVGLGVLAYLLLWLLAPEEGERL
jgi:phage shock protein PspC (stress-responsive transcriptional regulator)